jgi:hypothetical protein
LPTCWNGDRQQLSDNNNQEEAGGRRRQEAEGRRKMQYIERVWAIENALNVVAVAING